MTDPDLHRAAVLIQRLQKPIFIANMARPGLHSRNRGAERRYINALTEIDKIAKELYDGSTR